TYEVEAAVDVLLVGSLEGGYLGFFLDEGADEAGSGEVLLCLRGDVGEHSLDALEATVDACSEVLHEHGGDGERDEGAKGQLGADANHEGQRGRSENDGVRAVHDCRAEEQ